MPTTKIKTKVHPRPRQFRIYGYLRVSTIDQDTEKNKADILSFANSKGFLGQVEFVEEKVSGLKSWKKRKLKDLVESMSEGDILIVPELSRLGRSLVEVLEVLNELKPIFGTLGHQGFGFTDRSFCLKSGRKPMEICPGR